MKLAIGQPAPEIMLNNTEDVPLALSSLRGKVVLIDFWASWCKPCRMENPNVVKLYQKYKDKGFEIYGVSIDEDKAAWRKAIAKDNISWTQVIEVGAWDGRVAAAWKVEQLPTSYLLSKSGRVVAIDPFGKDLERKIVKQLSR